MRTAHRIPIVVIHLALLLASCAGTNAKIKPRAIATFYPNGQPRTEFFLRGTRIDSLITLFDTSGAVIISGDTRQKDLEVHKMSYRSPFDSSTLVPDRKITLVKELNRIFDGFAYKYRAFFIGSPPGEGTAILWINSKGKIEHAVFEKVFHVSDEMVGSLISELEAVELSPHTVSSGSIVKLYFRICP